MPTIDQVGEPEEVLHPKRRPAVGHHHKRVLGHHIGPSRGQRTQHAMLITEVDPILTPIAAVVNELEPPAEQRVEAVRHPDKSVPIIAIGCIRRLGPTPSRNAGCAPSGTSASIGC